MEKAQKNEFTPRDRLPKIIDIVDDTKVNTILTHFHDLEEKDNLTYTDEFVAELDIDYDDYLNGGKTYSAKEVETHTQELLKSLRVNDIPPTPFEY